MQNKPPLPNLELAFDVGHSSIGWAVLENQEPNLLGCGVVTFGADDCLASTRRGYRRQRRHIRATRLRIRRLSLLLEHLGVLSRRELDRPGCAWPWLLAARVLRGGALLTWPELWDVLRWYAHNRGYDGNKRWSRVEAVEEKEDTEKVNNARALYGKYNTHTMAETYCAVCGLDPLGEKKSCNLPGEQRPKALNAAFPREDIEAEVRRILEVHSNQLPELTDKFSTALLADWQAIPSPAIHLPDRFRGGLLFGQLVPRFENRIIATCPVTFERVFQEGLLKYSDPEQAKREAHKVAKVPSRECVEFYRFRWGMQLANIQVATGRGRETRPLSLPERKIVDAKMQERGYLTPGQFKEAVRGATGTKLDNLDQLLTHPDAQQALVLDPIKKLTNSHATLSILWPLLEERIRKRARGAWRRGKPIKLRTLTEASANRAELDSALAQLLDGKNTRKGKKEKSATQEDLLNEPLHAELLDGRAAYHRDVLRAAYDDVMIRGSHPKAEGGVLFRDEAIRAAQLQREIDEQTNNHLVRHRLRILERLHADVLKEYAGSNPARVNRVTIEVNRELRELSGKTRKEQEQDLGLRLANFKSVVKRLENAFEGKGIKIGPGLIRKARIAEDLGWTCPYTGKSYDEFDLLYRKVDKDHVIPRSDRASDSLDSLVITFAEVNKMKGKRTALQFVEEFQSRLVEGAPNLAIRTVRQFQDWVASLESFRGHDDDKRRKKRRKELLLLRDYVEKEFVPRDLTQTSQLVRLGAQMLQRPYVGLGKDAPSISSLPGSVTGATRKGWKLIGCLSKANPGILDEDGNPRTKTELREITHLHHALDASVLAFTAHFIPNNGQIWEMLVKRNGSLTESEKRVLKALGIFGLDEEGRFGLTQLEQRLKDQLRERLAERRVVQHIPSDMSGLSADQTVWRIFDSGDNHPSTKRLIRWLGEAGVEVPAADAEDAIVICRKRRSQTGTDSGKVLHETKTWRWVYQIIAKSKLLGLAPRLGSSERLKKLKAVKILGDNYGLALDPKPQIIRFHMVYPQLREMCEKNGGKWPRVLRNGQLIRVRSGSRAGIWRVLSTKSTEAYGLALNLALPDRMKLDRGNAPIQNLLENGMEIVQANYCGIDSSAVRSTEPKKRAGKKNADASACPITSSA